MDGVADLDLEDLDVEDPDYQENIRNVLEVSFTRSVKKSAATATGISTATISHNANYNATFKNCCGHA